MNDEIVKVES
jgi:hypothetical protein